MDTYLEQGGALVTDNTSKIDLVILKIANLDTGKIFTPSNSDWESIKKHYISLLGSPTLRNGHAVWTIRSLTRSRMSAELETRVQAGSHVYVKSSPFTLSPESQFPKFTLVSSEGSLTPSTVRADDMQGVNMLFQ